MEIVLLLELSSLAEDIQVKKSEASQTTDLDMQELLGIDNVWHSIQGELVNNTSALIMIEKLKERSAKS